MNYQKIYEDFISDRRSKPAPEGYVEKHHIIPRSLNGSDNDENLITLSAEDHYFSHLLLSKIYGGSMWIALQLMSSKPKRVTVQKISPRYMYRLARIKTAELASDRGKKLYQGNNNPCADLKIYEFININTGEKFNGTRSDLRFKRGVPEPSLKNVILGHSKSAFGWYLKGTDTRRIGKGFVKTDAEKCHQSKMMMGKKKGNGKKLTEYHKRTDQKIRCIEAKITFRNSWDAHEWLLSGNEKRPCKNRYDIKSVCRGKNKTAGGYHWQYA